MIGHYALNDWALSIQASAKARKSRESNSGKVMKSRNLMITLIMSTFTNCHGLRELREVRYTKSSIAIVPMALEDRPAISRLRIEHS
jgi:hypothetical protein